MTVRPLVFLDIDGVLNTRASMRLWTAQGRRVLDKSACTALLRICTITGAACVLSSTWRINRAPREVEHLIEAQTQVPCGVRIIGVTPRLPSSRAPDGRPVTRGLEIAAWIDWTGYTGPYVILDDDSDMRKDQAQTRLVLTPTETGLDEAAADLAIALLRNKL